MPQGDTRGIGRPNQQTETPSSGISWFLGIGINEYEHFTPLHNAVKDVKDLVILLQDQYGLKPAHTQLLFDAAATRDAIINALEKLVEAVQPQDKLIIYYSGHGHLQERTRRAYWIPQDAQRGNPSGYLRNSTVRDYIKDIDSLHTLLISDSCFSGSLFVRGTSRADLAATELEQRRSRWGIVSGRHDEEVYDGEPGTNSPFAASILGVLARNQRDTLRVAQLADEVVEMTRSNYQQLPEGNPLFGVNHDGGQYVFRLVGSETNLWARCQANPSIAACNAYLDRYPHGPHAGEALQQLKRLEEERAWPRTQRTDTIYAYREFLHRFPQGQYATAARDRIRSLQQKDQQLQEQQAWERAREQDTPTSYRNYLRTYPAGAQVAAATQRLRELEELEAEALREGRIQADWKRTQQQHSAAAYEAFARRYPQHPLASTARRQVAVLEQPTGAEKKQVPAEENTTVPSDRPAWRKYLPYLAGFLVVLTLIVWGVYRSNQSTDERSEAAAIENLPPYGLIPFEDFLTKQYGYRNAAGEVVIEAKYDSADSFGGNGNARVQQAGKTFYIDRTGACVRDCPDDSGTEPISDSADPMKAIEEEQRALQQDQTAWQQAQAENTVAAYDQYLRDHPTGNFTVAARREKQRLEKLAEEKARDQDAWQAARRKNTVAAYDQYLRSFPDGNHVSDARRAKQDLVAAQKATAVGQYPKKGTATLKGQSYQTIQFKANGLTWMADNLNYEVSDSWCYENKAANCQGYGRLYTWAAAKKACAALGSGWRLPTDEEWRTMAKQFGGADDDASDGGAAAYQALLKGGSSGFSARLGGSHYSDGSFHDLGRGGGYWSATERGSGRAWHYGFSSNEKLHSGYGTKSWGFSCRCIQD